jgi:hypothetical protein
MLKGIGWEYDRVKEEIQKAYNDGLYLETSEDHGKTEELHNLPGRIVIQMMTFNEDEQEIESLSVEARFDPNDKTETLYISDEWI